MTFDSLLSTSNTNVLLLADISELSWPILKACSAAGKYTRLRLYCRSLRWLRINPGIAARCAPVWRVSGVQGADENDRQSQKPADELYENFRASFVELATTTASSGPLHGSSSLADALDVAVPPRCVASLAAAPRPHFCRSLPVSIAPAIGIVNGHRRPSSEIIIGDPKWARSSRKMVVRMLC